MPTPTFAPSWRARAVALLAAALCVAAFPLFAQQPAASHPVSSRSIDDRWWKEGTVYQVYPRSFQDSDGNGVGDLRGITQRLPYLANLGIGSIRISPFFPSPMRAAAANKSARVALDRITLDGNEAVVIRLQ